MRGGKLEQLEFRSAAAPEPGGEQHRRMLAALGGRREARSADTPEPALVRQRLGGEEAALEHAARQVVAGHRVEHAGRVADRAGEQRDQAEVGLVRLLARQQRLHAHHPATALHRVLHILAVERLRLLGPHQSGHGQAVHGEGERPERAVLVLLGAFALEFMAEPGREGGADLVAGGRLGVRPEHHPARGIGLGEFPRILAGDRGFRFVFGRWIAHDARCPAPRAASYGLLPRARNGRSSGNSGFTLARAAHGATMRSMKKAARIAELARRLKAGLTGLLPRLPKPQPVPVPVRVRAGSR